MHAGSYTSTVLSIAAWFTCNIGLLLANKTVLNAWPQPVALTAFHFATCAVASQVAVRALGVPSPPLKPGRQRRGVAVLSCLFTLSVVAGNASLRLLPASFVQAVSSVDPIFTAFLALVVQGKRESLAVYASLLPIVLGTAAASGYEPAFHLVGFLFCMLAAGARALKSVMQETLLGEKSACPVLLLPALFLTFPHHFSVHSLSLLARVAPLATLLVVPFAALVEPGALRAAVAANRDSKTFGPLLAASCAAAFGLNVTNLLVTRATSALTLQVLGKAKAAIGVAASLALFRNPVTAGSLFGYAAVLVGLLCYGEARARAARRAAGVGSGAAAALPASGGANNDGGVAVAGHSVRHAAAQGVHSSPDDVELQQSSTEGGAAVGGAWNRARHSIVT